MLAPELRERLALMQDPWQHHAPTLAPPWCVPLHGLHELVLDGPIDAPPMHAFLDMLGALDMTRAQACSHAAGATPPAHDHDGTGSCVAWIGPSIMPSAVAIHRRGMDLRQHVWIPGACTPAERLWVFEEAARSDRCIAVVVDAGGWSAAMVRRAQLASSWQPDRTPLLAVAWRPQHEASMRSACTTRWLVQPVHDPSQDHAGPAWRIQSVRDRRGALDHAPACSSLRESAASARSMPWSRAS